jgi:RHS repeat-associated protein
MGNAGPTTSAWPSSDFPSQIWSTYDALNRRLTKAPTGEASISYGYDYTSHLLAAQASTDSAAYQFSYDTAGRANGEYSPVFGWTTATIDADGNRSSLTWPASASFTASYSYDQLNRLTGVYEGSVASGVRVGGYSYNALSQRTGASYGPATGPVASTSLTWTLAGHVAGFAHAWNGGSLALNYNYNQDHQRAAYSISDASFLAGGFAAGSAAYTTNAVNQYTAINGTAFSYDQRGNLTSDGTWTHGYDTENRLISATATGVTASYSYDALGRRLFKSVNGTTTLWASYNNQEIAEYQGPGNTVSLTRRFVYGAGLDEPIASVSASDVRTYQFQDALGSVILATNSAGQITEKYGYTAYGVTLSAGANTAAYRFTGRRYDAETGLYFYRNRAYSPTLGRFLQTDPIGTQGGVNLYAYAGNDPVNLLDPMGTVAQSESPTQSTQAASVPQSTQAGSGPPSAPAGNAPSNTNSFWDQELPIVDDFGRPTGNTTTMGAATTEAGVVVGGAALLFGGEALLGLVPEAGSLIAGGQTTVYTAVDAAGN